jgi:hypothetical protein
LGTAAIYIVGVIWEHGVLVGFGDHVFLAWLGGCFFVGSCYLLSTYLFGQRYDFRGEFFRVYKIVGLIMVMSLIILMIT